MKLPALLKDEWPLAVVLITAALFLVYGAGWLADLSRGAWFAFMSLWLLAVMFVSAFAVVRHAEALAERLGEPYGTLVLTLAITGIEVIMIAAIMYAGKGNSTLARDAMMAVVMIVLNGMLGLTLIVGGLRYREQTYNLQGANSFLAVILPLAVLGLIQPNFTVSTPGPVYSPVQATFLSVMSVVLYAVFLALQTFRHREYFLSPNATVESEDQHSHAHATGSTAHHALMLFLYILPFVVLSKQVAVPINHAIRVLHAPAELAGLLVSVLILSPESLTAVRAALANQLQRSVNVLLGSVLASIGLTIPLVLAVGFATGQQIVLGLGTTDVTLLVLTLALSMVTFAAQRTNMLLGTVHLLVFFAYLLFIFER